jgi:hypothetical protein
MGESFAGELERSDRDRREKRLSAPELLDVVLDAN